MLSELKDRSVIRGLTRSFAGLMTVAVPFATPLRGPVVAGAGEERDPNAWER